MRREFKIISYSALIIGLVVVLLVGIFGKKEYSDEYPPVPIKLGVFIETANAKYRLDEKLPSFEFATRDGKGRLFAALIGAKQVKPKKIEKNKVVYENVFPEVDIVYESFEDRLKENIILKSTSAPISFVYDLSKTFQGVDEFDLLSTNNILLTLYNKETGEELIMLEMPRAFDASGRFLAYHYRLQKEDGKTLLILEPHKQYDFAQFKYPITIDPPISVRQCDELLVKVGENGKKPALPKDGDIVAIKPCGWPWGKMERRDFVVVRVNKLTADQREEFTSRAEEDSKRGAIVYAVDYTKLATGGQLRKIRSYNKNNPILDATSLPLSDVIQKKPDVLGSIIPSERRLAKRIDTQFSTLRRLANRLIRPARAQTVNIFTIGTNGRDYSTIQAWEDARGGDLVTANTVEKGEMYNDSVFTAGVLIDGSTTDSTHYMWLTVAAADRHNGTAGSGARLDADSLAATAVIDVADPYTIVEWLEIYDSTPTTTQSTYGVRAQAGYGTYRNLIIHDIGSGSGGTDNSAGWTGWTTIGAGETSKIYNNFIYSINGQGIQLIYDADVFNNTLYNNAAYGIMVYSTSSCSSSYACRLVNNISVGNNTGTGGAADFETADLEATNDIMNNNLSSDGTADDCSSCLQSLDNIVGQPVEYLFSSIEDGFEDLHILDGSAALDSGTSTPSLIFSNDIDGDDRPYDTVWDIGADEKSCPDGWWSCQWHYRRKITFDNSSQSSALIDFPAGVHLNSSRINYNNTQNAGQDIRFVDGNSSTSTLYYEIEEWNESGTSTIWVRVPEIASASSSDYIWMYYGNPYATTTASSTAVWDDNFVMVQHMEESVNTSTGGYKDSTKNGNDGTGVSMSLTPTAGIAGIAQDFDGSADYIYINDTADLRSGTGPHTREVWFKAPNASQYGLILSKNGCTSNGLPTTSIGISGSDLQSAGDSISANYGHSLTAGYEDWWPNNDVTDDSWHYVALTISSSNGTFYLDTNLVSKRNDIGTPDDSGTDPMNIGALNALSCARAGFFDGLIDEVRVSKVARSSDWLNFTYCNIKDSCNSYGAEESYNGIPIITSVFDYPDPVAAGDSIHFAVDWKDANDGEMVKVLVCKTNSLSGNNCVSAWCTSPVFTNRDPETCSYTTQTGDIGLNNYYAFVCDDGGACSSSAAGTFTVEERSPSAPSDLLVENMPNPVNISTTTPRFSAIFNDPNIGDLANKYCIQVNTASDFSGTDMWVADSNSCNSGVAMATTTQGMRSPDIYYNGTALSLNNTTYYWRIWFWDDSGNKSATSTTANFTMANQGTGVRLKGGRLKGGVRLK